MGAQQQLELTEVKTTLGRMPEVDRVEMLAYLLGELDVENLPRAASSHRQALLKVLPAAMQKGAIELSNKILSTLEIRDNGSTGLSIPAGVSDVRAMKALNVYFRNKFPSMNCAAIYEGDLEWYEQFGTASKRDNSLERKIEINVLVDTTIGLDLSAQYEALQAKNLRFADPEEVALVLVSGVCKYGKDLLNGYSTRNSVSGHAHEFVRGDGARISCPLKRGYPRLGAAGARIASN